MVLSCDSRPPFDTFHKRPPNARRMDNLLSCPTTIVKNRCSHSLRWCDYDGDWGECLPDVTPIIVKRWTRLNKTFVVDVERLLSGQEKFYHSYELQTAQMLVWMESEYMGVCKHSSSSRLDDLVHQRFFYDLSLQLINSWRLLNPLLELYNYLVTNYSNCRYGYSGYASRIRMHV